MEEPIPRRYHSRDSWRRLGPRPRPSHAESNVLCVGRRLRLMYTSRILFQTRPLGRGNVASGMRSMQILPQLPRQKNNGHDGLKPLFLRLCFDKQLRVCRLRPARAALPRSRQSLLTRQVSRCLSYLCHLLGQLMLPLSTMPLEHPTPSPAYAAPRPKSGEDCIPMLFHCRGLRLVIFFLQASRSLSAIEPRVGGAGSRHPPEAVRFDTYRTAHTAKPSDSSFTTSRVSVYPAFATSYRKRAYTRALSRANRCGSTMCRGQCIYGSRPPGLQPSADQHRPAPSPASQVRQAARLHSLSWNSGGLSSERYQQLALWLRTAGQHIGVVTVAVQETHWSQDLSFHMDGWLALTSPCLRGLFSTMARDIACSSSAM